MVLLWRVLLAGAALAALGPVGADSERVRRAGRRRSSSNSSHFSRVPPLGTGPGTEPGAGQGTAPEFDEPELEQLLRAAEAEPANNSSSMSRSQRVKRQLVIPNGLTVGIIPRFDYTVFTNPNGEQLVVSVDVEIDYTFPQTSSSGKSALNRMSRMLYDKQTIYSSMETVFTRFGLDGRACTLRAICEVGETPDHQDGLVGDFLNYLLSASYGVGERSELKAYLQAERYGRKYGHCGAIFPSCPVSIFALVTDDEDEEEKEEGEKKENMRRTRSGRAEKFPDEEDDVKED